MSDLITVEVAFALTGEQHLVEIRLPVGVTASQAVEAAGILEGVDARDRETLTLGVWGRVVEPDHRLDAGDRVEIYRPLRIDPRDARRKLAESGRTMREGPAPAEDD